MKLRQIKPFTSETITPELAGKLMAIIGLQSMFTSEKWGALGFTITDEFFGKSTKGTGSNLCDLWNDPNYSVPGYERVQDGVEIVCNYIPNIKCRLYGKGRGTMLTIHRKGELKSHYTGDSTKGIPPSSEYYDKTTTYTEFPCDPIKLIQLFIDEGFYTVDVLVEA